ncbi:MAG TPA: phospholipase C, phosphocholine-specific [Puia sp.]|nr:phospholipase C, phosphocholine-specific [Puia sp.]
MDSRREFIKKATILAGATGLAGVLPASIQRAMAINPSSGSSWLDAEHVVILMQENRSFDHCFGNLKGVRGYRDPRAITLPNGNPVWLQTNEAGETYAPFRLDIKGTKATWMGSLPHSWTNQVDARNGGKYDKWLPAKPSGYKPYAHMPLTMGYYDRRDIPFYYALADAFTVCDQNFCSSLTGTTPNRLYLWTGTIRDEQHANVRARVRNGDTDYRVEAAWPTFPERLEDNGIDWRIYQNEISLHLGFKGEEDAWLSNFTDNPIEWFSQYNVRFSASYMPYLPAMIEALTEEVGVMEQRLAKLPADSADHAKAKEQLSEKQAILQFLKEDRQKITPENYEKLSQRAKNLHWKAFTTNSGDPSFRELTSLQYQDGDTQREMLVPKGDVLHQFREDVRGGKLPVVSWLVPPENFSDHPGAPWYGAWYVSEVMDILTQDPEVWKKTIFLLCYDENDGYFDHQPPFVAPDPMRPETGLVSTGIDAGVEYVTKEQDMDKETEKDARGGPIGLGYRVPLLIASPWSRGGYVNSQVFDHTSIIQFMEKFLRHKTGAKIEETNISAWRRAVCGDLSSVFRSYHGEKGGLPAFVQKNEFIESVHKAQFKELPAAYKQLTPAEQDAARHHPETPLFQPEQERGVRPSCALPYELYADGRLSDDKKSFEIKLKAGKDVFGATAAGAPFIIYAYGKEIKIRNYALVAGDRLTDHFPLEDFANGQYDLRVYGPNGFFRSFIGSKDEPALTVRIDYERAGSTGSDKAVVGPAGSGAVGMQKLSGCIQIHITGLDKMISSFPMHIEDNYPKEAGGSLSILHGTQKGLFLLDPASRHGWYDFTVVCGENGLLEKRYAGRVETGKDSFSDPAMG